MNDRIKKLRKSLDLTQQEFADRIGVKRNTIATYEIGRNTPLDAVIASICKTYNVSETWLRTGEGEMFVQKDTLDFNEFLDQHGASELEGKILRAYFRLPVDLRQELLKRFTSNLESEAPPVAAANSESAAVPAEPPIQPGEEEVKAEARAEAKRYYYQLLAERRPESQTSTASELDAG